MRAFRDYGLDMALIAGGSTTTQLAVTGLLSAEAIATEDELVMVIEMDTGTSIAWDRTANFAISAAGYIQNTTNDTSGHKLQVFYIDKN